MCCDMPPCTDEQAGLCSGSAYVCRDMHKALAERKEAEVRSMERGMQKQVADSSQRHAAWGQKELALSATHVCPACAFMLLPRTPS